MREAFLFGEVLEFSEIEVAAILARTEIRLS
jgi:hypothetical protein